MMRKFAWQSVPYLLLAILALAFTAFSSSGPTQFAGVQTGAGVIGPGSPVLVGACLSDVTVQAVAFGSTPMCLFPPSGITASSPINASLTFYAKVTQAATTSSVLGPFTFTYTDCGDGTSQVLTIASAAGNLTSTQINGTVIACVKPSTTPTFTMGYTSVGATPMQYEMHIRIEDLY